jgi:hypothetical protein
MAVSNLHTNNIDLRTDDTDAAIGQFSSNDFAYWLSYGTQLTSRLSIGANLKYVREVLDTTDASAYAADGGLLYETDWHDLRLGTSLQNLGTRIKFVDESDPLPLQYRLGASMPVGQENMPAWLRSLRLSSDLIIPRDSAVGIAFGAEYHRALRDELSYDLRTGYRTGSSVTGLSGLSAGGGLEFGRFGMDFAWVPYGELGNSYQYSLHIKFGAADHNAHAPDHNMQKSVTPVPALPVLE